jgi:hypothetical protein
MCVSAAAAAADGSMVVAAKARHQRPVPCSWHQNTITKSLNFSNHLLPCFFTFGLDQAATTKLPRGTDSVTCTAMSVVFFLLINLLA